MGDIIKIYPLSLSVTVQARKDLLWREVDGEVVLLDPRAGLYFGVEGTGVRIWEHLQEKTTLGKIVPRLLGEFDVDAKTLQKDILEFSKELADAGLIEIFPSPRRIEK